MKSKDYFDAILTILGEHTERFNTIDSRLSGLENRMERIETKVDNLEAKTDNLEAKVDNLEEGQQEIRSTLEVVMDRVTDNTKDIDKLKKNILN